MGSLQGFKVLEFAGIGPGPFACMMLSDMGAEVLRIDRAESSDVGVMTGKDFRFNITARGRRSVALDLKNPDAKPVVLRLVQRADALVEGYRPGTMERLGLGPAECLSCNPRLVYGRITGWGQEGPLASVAGHDINYASLAGAMHYMGPEHAPPVPPLNLAGDFGGGGMLLAFGIVCGLLEAQTSDRGQVIDAAMVDGISSLMASIYGLRSKGMLPDERTGHFLDGSAPWYSAYATSDGRYVSIGPIEAKFFKLLLRTLGVDEKRFPNHLDRECWPALRATLAGLFVQRTRDEWMTLLEGTDACASPVLSLREVAEHPHIRARETVLEIDGVPQPAPAPRFSRTYGTVQGPAPWPGQHTDAALADWGFSAAEIADLKASGAAVSA